MTSTEYPGGHRRVLSAEVQGSQGRVRLVMDGPLTVGVAMPWGRSVLPRDVRSAPGELLDAHTTLWNVLRALLLDLSVLYVEVPETDANNVIELGIAPPGDQNAFGVLQGLGYLINNLRERAQLAPIGDPEVAHTRLTDPDSAPNMGWNGAGRVMLTTLAGDLVTAFNAALAVNAP